MIDMLIQWHIIKDGDMPENYEIDYSYKCNEFSKPVWVVLDNGSLIKASRCRKTTEENFSWVTKKSNSIPLVFKHKPILWAFVPTMAILRKLAKPYLHD